MNDPGQATPDELAALYLRGRDVPCPGCGYNRRDGTAAACPECGAGLSVGGAVTERGMTMNPPRATAVVMILLTLSVFLMINFGLATAWAWWVAFTNPGLVVGRHWVSGVVYGIGFTCTIPAVALSAALCTHRKALFRKPRRAGNRFAATSLWLFVAVMPELIYELWSMIEWLMS